MCKLGLNCSLLTLLLLFSGELSNAQSGSLSLANSPMHVARSYQTAVPVANGSVLMIGGEQTDAQVESFALPAGIFSQTGSMLTPRTHQTATLLLNGCPPTLSDGCILIAGGIDQNSNTLNSAELYDPTSGISQAIPGGMNVARSDHRATLLQDGTVLITGGVDPNGNTLSSAEMFNPATGTFSLLGNTMQHPRTLHTATLLTNGQVLIAGSADYSTNQACSTVSAGDCSPTVWTNGDPSAELYDPGSQQFIPTGNMQAGRWVILRPC